MSAGDHEVEREARRIFRKLASGPYYLAPLSMQTFAVARGGRVTRTRVDRDVVFAWLKRGWLSARAEAAGTFALNDAGEGWLLRTQTSIDPYGAQHQLLKRKLVATPEGERSVLVNEAESTLGWLRNRGIVNGLQHDAGERLRRDFTMAQLSARMGVDWTKPISRRDHGPKQVLISDMAIAARQRFAAAMKSVGPGLSDLLYDVCCQLLGLEGIERSKGWPKRSGKIVLQIALDRLAAHYGMQELRPGNVRAWRREE
jgi:hypothetical protein